jgi:hypothetical protein
LLESLLETLVGGELAASVTNKLTTIALATPESTDQPQPPETSPAILGGLCQRVHQSLRKNEATRKLLEAYEHVITRGDAPGQTDVRQSLASQANTLECNVAIEQWVQTLQKRSEQTRESISQQARASRIASKVLYLLVEAVSGKSRGARSPGVA